MATNQLTINPNNLDDIVCDVCEGAVFTPAMRIKYIPALMSPDGTPGTFNMQFGFICVKCGKIYGIMDLVNMKAEQEKKKSKLILLGREHES